MKIINLHESQYNRLFEDIENWGKSPIADYQTQDEVVTTSKIHDKDGDIQDSEPKDTQAKQDQMSMQDFGARTKNRNW